MKTLKSDDIIKVLRREGFVPISQRGSHIKFRHPDKRQYIVANGKKILPGWVKEIANDLGINIEQFFPDQQIKSNGSIQENNISQADENNDLPENPEKSFLGKWPDSASTNSLLALGVEDIAYWLLGSSTVREEVENNLKELQKIANRKEQDEVTLSQQLLQLKSFLIDQILEGCRKYQPPTDWRPDEIKEIEDTIFRRIFYEPDEENKISNLDELHHALGSFLALDPEIGITADNLCRYIEDFNKGEKEKILVSLAVLLVNEKKNNAVPENGSQSQILSEAKKILAGHSRETIFQKVEYLLLNSENGLNHSQVKAMGDILEYFRENDAFVSELKFPQKASTITAETTTLAEQKPVQSVSQTTNMAAEKPETPPMKVKHLDIVSAEIAGLREEDQMANDSKINEDFYKLQSELAKTWDQFLKTMERAIETREFPENGKQLLERIQEQDEELMRLFEPQRKIRILEMMEESVKRALKIEDKSKLKKKMPQKPPLKMRFTFQEKTNSAPKEAENVPEKASSVTEEAKHPQEETNNVPEKAENVQEETKEKYNYAYVFLSASPVPTDERYLITTFEVGRQPTFVYFLFSDIDPHKHPFFKLTSRLWAQLVAPGIPKASAQMREGSKNLIGAALLEKMKSTRFLSSNDDFINYLEKYDAVLDALPLIKHNRMVDMTGIIEKILNEEREIQETLKLAYVLQCRADLEDRTPPLIYRDVVRQFLREGHFMTPEKVQRMVVANAEDPYFLKKMITSILLKQRKGSDQKRDSHVSDHIAKLLAFEREAYKSEIESTQGLANHLYKFLRNIGKEVADRVFSTDVSAPVLQTSESKDAARFPSERHKNTMTALANAKKMAYIQFKPKNETSTQTTKGEGDPVSL